MYNIVYTKYIWNTGFSSNTETAINRFDIVVFFFSPFSSAVFKMTQKCIINNINFWHLKNKKTKTEITLTHLVHTQSQVVQVYNDWLEMEEGPGSTLATLSGRSKPTERVCICERVCVH